MPAGPVPLEASAHAAGRRRARHGFSIGIGGDAHQHGFIRVDGEGAAAARLDGDLGDLMGSVGVQIRGEDGAFLGVVNLAGLMASHENVHTPLDHLIDFARSQIDGGNSVRIGDDQLLAIGRVGVLMEIERSSAVFARKADHAMAGVGIDPFGWQRGLRGEQAHPGEGQEQETTHHSRSWRLGATESYRSTGSAAPGYRNAMLLMPETSNRLRQRRFLQATLSSISTM